jgi:hypothetical protein
VIGPVRFAFVVTFPAVSPEAVPVRFVATPDDGVPRAGVTRVGEVDKTTLPVPVDVVTPVPPFATGSVPVTPVVKGKPVRFVATPDAGVPNAGVTSVGDVAKTRAPDPVSSVTAVARFALDGVARAVATPDARPLMPVLTGSPVAFVRVAAEGVPKFGVVSVGDACITNVDPVPVWAATAVALPVEVIGPVRFAFVVTFPAVSPAAVPVRFVATPDAGVPRTGVTRVGEVERTTEPDPVVPFERSLAANWATVKAPPLVVCLTTCDVPPVAEKSVVPAGRVSVFVPATGGGRTVKAPEVEPLRAMLWAPAIAPVVSATVTGEFWTSSPVVPSKRTIALSVELPGPTVYPVAVLASRVHVFVAEQ